MHREGDDGGRGRHRHGRLEPAARERPAERAGLCVLDAPRGDEAAGRAHRPHLCSKWTQVEGQEIQGRPSGGAGDERRQGQALP